MSRTDAFLEQVETHLFSSVEELEAARISQAQRTRLMRLREMYFLWREHPRMMEKDIVTLLRIRYHIGTSAAYDDLHILRRVLGKMTVSPQEYHRWVFLQRYDEAWQLARANQDARAMAKLLNTYGKYNRLDAPEESEAPYSEIVPPFLDITGDASIAGFKPIKNASEVIARLEKQYAREIEFREAEELEEINPLTPQKYKDDEIHI